MSKSPNAPQSPNGPGPGQASAASAATEALPGTERVDPTQIARELAEAQRVIAEQRAEQRDLEERASREIDRLTRELTQARAAADSARSDAPPRTAHGDTPVRLRALSGIAFTLGGTRRRLRTGEVIEAHPAELEDDGLVFGKHFEFARD